jgi:branched-chain amino acid transport system permease protein
MTRASSPTGAARPPSGFVGAPTAFARAVLSPAGRLLGCCLVGSLLLAVMTGPDGSEVEPLAGITGSLHFPRVAYFLGFGLFLWAVMTLVRLYRHGGLPRVSEFRSNVASLSRETWARWLRGRIARPVLGVVSFLLMVVVVLLVSGLTGPYHANKVSAGRLIHQLRYSYTYGYLLFGVVLWRLAALRVLERHGLREPKPPRRGPLHTTMVVVGCLLGGLVLALAANPWLDPVFRWDHVSVSAPSSIWREWPTYFYLLGSLVVARIVLHNQQRPTTLTAGGRRRRFTTPQISLTVYLAILFVAIEWPKFLAPYWQSNITTQIGTYALLALGLNVVVGFTGLLDLGYVAFWAVGAYTAAYFTNHLPLHPPFVLNEFFIIPFAIAAAMIVAVLIGMTTLRLRGDYLAIVTLGFGEIVEVLLNNWTTVTNGSQGTIGHIPPFSINFLGIHYTWDVANPLPYYYVLLVFIVGAIFVFNSLNHSRVGRRWAAIRENELAAASIGVNPLKYKIMAFAIGASTAGFAGVFTASSDSVLFPQSFILQYSILILALVIFGGLGSIVGVLFAAAFFNWIQLLLQIHPFPGYQDQDFYMFIGALFVLTMIFRPQGVFPSRRRQREISLAEAGMGYADPMSAEGGASDPFEGAATRGGEVGPGFAG